MLGPALHACMTEDSPASPSKHRPARLWLRAFCLLGSPPFVLGIVGLPISLCFWPHRRDGVQEGPEPTDTGMVLSMVALAGFVLAYAFAACSLWARGSARWSLRLPLVLPLAPILLWMGVYLSDTALDPVSERWWTLLYPALLVLTLLGGLLTAVRHHDSGRLPHA